MTDTTTDSTPQDDTTAPQTTEDTPSVPDDTTTPQGTPEDAEEDNDSEQDDTTVAPEDSQGDPAKLARKLTREAAKYRKRLADTNTENEGLRAAVAALQHHIINAEVAKVLADPADFDAFVKPEQVLDEAGNLDMSKLEHELEELAEKKPYLVKDSEPEKRGLKPGPRPRRGTPAPKPSDPKVTTSKSLADQMTYSGATWSSLLNRDGEHRPGRREFTGIVTLEDSE